MSMNQPPVLTFVAQYRVNIIKDFVNEETVVEDRPREEALQLVK